MRVIFRGSADHRPDNARSRLCSSLRELRVRRGAQCDCIAALLNATGAIQRIALASFDTKQTISTLGG